MLKKMSNVISIHALREEGDVAAVRIGGEATLFLSTPSARRATPQQQTLRGESNISIHALREEGDNSKQARRAAISISIHALREEGDQTSQVKKLHRHDFYPRPPRGGRRQSSKQICRQTDYFYPRPPRGGRRLPPLLNSLDAGFLSTPSARRATRRACNHHGRNKNFYPRPPRGGRPSAILRRTDRESISIHALREEGDSPFANLLNSISRFLSTPSVRRATLSMVANAGAS